MKAFPNTLITRDLMIADMIAHRREDQLIAGFYGETKDGEFRGCAVGCSIHTINRVLGTNHQPNNHAVLAELIGVPVGLVRLQDRIFESLFAKDRVFWPERFYRAIPTGSDQSDTLRRISIRILRETALAAIIGNEWGCRDAVIKMADALESGDAERINAARIAAARAANAATGAADAAFAAFAAFAADAAAFAVRARVAAYAARAAVRAAWCVAADTATDAAVYAADVAVYAARAADAAAYAARAAAWQQIADIACEEMTRAALEITSPATTEE